jgi:TonB-dependent receptor
MSWFGLGGLIRYDIPSLVANGTLTKQALFQNKVGDSSGIHEKIATVFGQLDIDTEIFDIPLRGNLGVQAVRSDQQSDGWEYRGTISNPDINLLFKRTGGATYTDYLPSLNLVAELKPSLIARVGLGKTMARPNINQMRAGTTTPTLINDPPPPGGGASNPLNGTWTERWAGNPQLEPWRATAYDFSLEKYFGKRSYIGAAAFRKKLTTYVFDRTSLEDNSAFPLPAVIQPGVVVQTTGIVHKPVNGSGGNVDGVELSASLEGGLFHPMLDGFGIVWSQSNLGSDIKDDTGKPIAINGLSGISANTTVYYEKHGFSARISERYRSPFSATTRDIFFNNVTRQQDADRVLDVQLSYAFEEGTYKGLSFLLQVNNVRDSKTTSRTQVTGLNKNSVPDPTMLLPEYTYQFGRQIFLGINYKL